MERSSSSGGGNSIPTMWFLIITMMLIRMETHRVPSGMPELQLFNLKAQTKQVLEIIRTKQIHKSKLTPPLLSECILPHSPNASVTPPFTTVFSLFPIFLSSFHNVARVATCGNAKHHVFACCPGSCRCHKM